jgi:hypothetical protein
MRHLHDNGPNRCHQCHVKAKKSGKKLGKDTKKPEAIHFRLYFTPYTYYIYYVVRSLVSIRRYSTGVRPVTS